MTENDKHTTGKHQTTDTKCPICNASVALDSDTFPFCSKRCKQIDLGKWLKGDYLISRPLENRDLDED
jgi:uncharacterized protein